MICGIDIGLSGAICMLEQPHAYSLFKMPTVNVNDKNDVDLKELFNILDKHNINYIVIEKINNIYGISKNTMLSLGKQIGYITAYATIRNIPLITVKPKDWIKHIHKDVVEFRVDGNYKETFYKSISKLIEILGKDDVDKNFLIRKRYHDGMVDAYLLAYYVYDKIKK